MPDEKQTLQDWLSAQSRLLQGRVSDPSQDAIGPAEVPDWWWEQQRYRERKTPGLIPRPEDVEALPLGSLGDPVSQAAFLLAPGVLRGSKALADALAQPGMPSPLGGYRLLSDLRGSTGLPRSRLPRPALEDYTHWRYGKPPASGFSTNARDNVQEAGVSAFPIQMENLSPQAVRSALGIQDRPIYLLKGTEVGKGADAEPLLRVEHSIKAPTGWETEMPWGFVRQPGTPREELARKASEYGLTLPRQATGFEIYDNEGQLAASWQTLREGLWSRRSGLYDVQRYGVQARPLPKAASRSIFRNNAGKEVIAPAVPEDTP